MGSSGGGTVFATMFFVVVLPTLVGIAIRLALAFLCANIAKKKGNGYASWFVLGLFFGLIALLIICCEPEKTAVKKHSEQNHDGVAWQNPAVNQNQGGQSAQQYFNGTQNAFAVNEVTNQNVKWRCNNCGYMNDPRARDCVICNQKRAGF